MGVLLTLDLHSHGISIGLSVLGPPVEAVVEPLPLVPAVSEIVGVSMVELQGLLQVLLNQVEVESNLPLNLGAVQQDQELGLVSGVEEKLHFWSSVAIDLDMGKSCIIAGEVFIILLDLLANGVPLGMEVETGECWLVLVQVRHAVVHRLWHYPVLPWNCVHRSLGILDALLIDSTGSFEEHIFIFII